VSNFLSAGKSIPALMCVVLLPALLMSSAPARADVYRSLDPDAPTVLTDVPPSEGNWERIATDDAAPVPADGRRENNRASYSKYIDAAATENNVDAALIHAVIKAESGYNPAAVSRAGAIGLMQLMPETASRYNVTDSRNPEQNIQGGTRYLRDLLTMFNNDLRLVIAAYNAGEQAVMKYGNRIPPYRETLAYVPKVLKFYASLRNVRTTSAHKRAAVATTKRNAPRKVVVMNSGSRPGS
jgi:soluble lytic murein transglycosylase-like protein